MHIYWGDKDRLLPLSFAYEVKQHFAKGMVHVIENCGHLPMREQPEKLARLLKSNRDTDLLLLNSK
jgi:pimeloyl-ACP methyl ester carboxylesterase